LNFTLAVCWRKPLPCVPFAVGKPELHSRSLLAQTAAVCSVCRWQAGTI
jgi:hypothetical protein